MSNATHRKYGELNRYQQRIAAMLADPECTGDLLALGISLLDYAVLNVYAEEPPTPEGVTKLPSRGRRQKRPAQTWAHYANRAWGSARDWKVKDVLRKDIRRYDAVQDAETTTPGRICGAPMIRRQGPCGNSATRRAMLTDPYTGRRQWLAACSRHQSWFDQQKLLNNAALGEVDIVMTPAANTGGVLARHIPEIDWLHVWKQLDPNWVEPPEGEDEPTQPPPGLRLIMGGA